MMNFTSPLHSLYVKMFTNSLYIFILLTIQVLEETVVASPGYRVTLLSASTLALVSTEYFFCAC